MDTNKMNWTLGEVVRLTRQTLPINKKYEYMMTSQYICIRESVGMQRGILLKVLGKTSREDIIMQGGKPFCKDDKFEGLYSDTYYSFRFPSVKELKEVLDILRKDEPLLKRFEAAHMHINPHSNFWVRNTASRFFFFKEPQYYNAQLNQLFAATTTGDDEHYRLTIVYFHNSQLIW